MQRIEIAGTSPHFIGCWKLEPPSICDDLIEFFEAHSDKQEAGQSAGGVNPEVKHSIDLTVHPRDLEAPEYAPVKSYVDALFECYKDYVEQYPFLGSIMPRTDISSFNIQKYLPGGHFRLEHSERTSIINSYRVLAWMSYLNDVSDGGSTTFTQQNLSVQPEKGKTLIWPSEWTHAHRGDIVNSGLKYVITGWMHFPHEER